MWFFYKYKILLVFTFGRKKDNYTFQKQNMKSKVMLQIIKQQRSQDFKLGFKVKLGLLIKLLGYRFLKRHL